MAHAVRIGQAPTSPTGHYLAKVPGLTSAITAVA
ncbi:hypothetical protein JOE31_001240 [Arthrobacter sp. PvP023]|nr:hypothetical protein [Arthrobacter sp. PvP023]